MEREGGLIELTYLVFGDDVPAIVEVEGGDAVGGGGGDFSVGRIVVIFAELGSGAGVVDIGEAVLAVPEKQRSCVGGGGLCGLDVAAAHVAIGIVGRGAGELAAGDL